MPPPNGAAMSDVKCPDTRDIDRRVYKKQFGMCKVLKSKGVREGKS